MVALRRRAPQTSGGEADLMKSQRPGWSAVGAPVVFAGVIAVTAFAGPAAAAATPDSCARACLTQVLDAYLAAVVKHDPPAAPLAAGYRGTENAGVVAPGEGLWKSAAGLGPVQRRFADPVNGQAAYFGHLQEGSARDIVAVRVKITGRKVTEAEWTVARKGAFGMFEPDGLTANAPPAVHLPPAQRSDRFQMIALADGYFQGLQDHDGSLIPAEPQCERIENGVKVTFRPRGTLPGAGAAPPGAPSGPAPPSAAAPTGAQEEMSGNCVAGFQGFKTSIAETTLRRFPLVDEEMGVVMGTTVFRRPTTSQMRRNLLTEFFFVRGGKLAGIWAAMYYLPVDAPHSNGWP
jgi:hypothetical protein